MGFTSAPFSISRRIHRYTSPVALVVAAAARKADPGAPAAPALAQMLAASLSDRWVIKSTDDGCEMLHIPALFCAVTVKKSVFLLFENKLLKKRWCLSSDTELSIGNLTLHRWTPSGSTQYWSRLLLHLASAGALVAHVYLCDANVLGWRANTLTIHECQ